MSDTDETPAQPPPSAEENSPVAIQSREKKRRGGRAPGVPNRVTREMKEAWWLAFEGIGGVEAFKAWARKHQTAFYRIGARMLPSGHVLHATQVNNFNAPGTERVRMTPDEVGARWDEIARGLRVDIVDSPALPAPARDATVIDVAPVQSTPAHIASPAPYLEPVSVTPAEATSSPSEPPPCKPLEAPAPTRPWQAPPPGGETTYPWQGVTCEPVMRIPTREELRQKILAAPVISRKEDKQ